MTDIFEILARINSPELQSFFLPVKIAFIIIGLFFLGMIIFTLRKTTYMWFAFSFDVKEFLQFKAGGAKKITKKWQTIVQRLETAKDDEYKLAIIEADGILNSALNKLGAKGQSIEDKVAQLPQGTIPNVSEILTATQIRNGVIHDPDYRITKESAQMALKAYETAFGSLDLL